MPIPTAKVIAKPLTGPEVCKKDQSRGFARIKAVTKVAIFASLIESHALPKETSSAFATDLCPFSSLNLSKISILESTAIPTDRRNPAIPGRVRTTPISLYKAKVKTPKTIRPKSAIIPNLPYARIINKQTIIIPTIPAFTLFATDSTPKVAPTVLSSIREIGTGRAPAFN